MPNCYPKNCKKCKINKNSNFLLNLVAWGTLGENFTITSTRNADGKTYTNSMVALVGFNYFNRNCCGKKLSINKIKDLIEYNGKNPYSFNLFFDDMIEDGLSYNINKDRWLYWNIPAYINTGSLKVESAKNGNAAKLIWEFDNCKFNFQKHLEKRERDFIVLNINIAKTN